MYYKKVTETHTCWHSHYLLGNDPNNINDINQIRNVLNQKYENVIENIDQSIVKDIVKDNHAYNFDEVERISILYTVYLLYFVTFDLNCVFGEMFYFFVR